MTERDGSRGVMDGRHHASCTWCGRVEVDSEVFVPCGHCDRGVMLPPRLVAAWREGVRRAREAGDDLGCPIQGCALCRGINETVQ